MTQPNTCPFRDTCGPTALMDVIGDEFATAYSESLQPEGGSAEAYLRAADLTKQLGAAAFLARNTADAVTSRPAIQPQPDTICQCPFNAGQIA